ncbi:hypothetical protein PCANC_22109 [Puccinia coronata f. sp. avenae]|uniref:Uncharacterized protein n=1 Tax=Puccinia coronata f. sp. avenae TaxID=200324 RepID=A0A2N5TKV5_9BASI|nr:hypothetical protein PCANC_22109 [Puccinia coronata f. sp. avenae]
MSELSATLNNSQSSPSNSQAPPSNQQALCAVSGAASGAKNATPPLILPSLPPGVAPIPRTTLAGSTSAPPTSQSGTATDRKTVDVQALAALKKKYEDGCKQLSSILEEAEGILGDRVSHHKKAWSAAETTFKTSVSKWETQIAAAKTPTIDVEAEYAAVLPSIQIPKKRAAPGTSTKTAPRRRAKKNSVATTVEEIVGISGVDDLSISELANALGDGGSNEPTPSTSRAAEPGTSDRATGQSEEPDSGPAQQKTAAEKERAKEREEARAKAEAEKIAAMLLRPVSFLGKSHLLFLCASSLTHRAMR